MATDSEIGSELAKLKKEYLIDIIVTKRIPTGTSVSGELRIFIENNENVILDDPNDDFPENSDSNFKSAVEMLTLNSELKVTKIELNCAQNSIKGLGKTIIDEEMIINLLNSYPNKSMNQPKCDVADVTKNSENAETNSNLTLKSTNGVERTQKLTTQMSEGVQKK
ncbi:hypothetical protein HHI36_016660 [Cryptolaemus montrouzieri]|uniref:Uncharacterized protein n=1 Tax=Cryptolaemus montrouzieri TaxID=559131 RepID=A0ABD2NLG6_9CUCU